MSKATGWTTCDICGARLKAEKLDGHMKHVHPKGVKTQEERVKIVGRRRAATGVAKYFAIAAIIVVVILVGYFVYQSLDLRGSNVGDKPYNFTLEDLDGTKYSLDEHLGDRPILLGFMSTTCVHCARMSEVYQALYVNYSDDVDFVIVISNADATDSAIINWANTHHLEFSVVHDVDSKYFDKYGLSFYPSMYIINKSGKISWTNKDTNQGEYSYQTLAGKLDKVK